jgi:gamma-carbonic anhydrase
VSGLIFSFAGKTPQIDPTAFVAPNATITGDVTIGAEASVWFGAVVRGDEHAVTIGARSNIQDLSMCHETSWIGPLIIGEDVTVGHRAILHGCLVHDRCLIGMGAIILDGAEIGSESVVAAGAVVREGMKVPPGSLVAGVPARIVREVGEELRGRIINAAAHYVQRAAAYRGISAD